MSYSILPVSRYRLKDLLCKVYHQNIYLSIYKLTFLERKVSQRISHRIYHFILVKFLRFQGTFYKKSFGRGLGQTPQLITLTQKARHCRAFYFSEYVGTAFQTLLQGAFCKKPLENPQKLHAEYINLFGKAFGIPKDFSRKVLCVGVPRRKPQLIMPTKNAEKSAFFLYLRKNIFCS